jgi:hypothetical protein
VLGLHPSDVDTVDTGVRTGGIKSSVQVTWRTSVSDLLPQTSVTIQILVLDLEQPIDTTEPSEAVGVSEPLQLSDAIAPPNADSIVSVDGLHPSADEAVAVAVIIGAVIS